MQLYLNVNRLWFLRLLHFHSYWDFFSNNRKVWDFQIMIIEVLIFCYGAFPPPYKEHCFNNCIDTPALVKHSVAKQHLVQILKYFLICHTSVI